MPVLTDNAAPTNRNPGWGTDFSVGAALAAWSTWLSALIRQSALPAPQPQALIGPLVGLVGLTAVVCLAMVLLRNYAILTDLASATYYADYKSNVPAEWIERPARTFNNLMQVPILFYLVCVLMLLTQRVDRAQLALAWAFVGARVVHALVYIVLNYVPARFGCWVASCIALGAIWTRFALQTWQLW